MNREIVWTTRFKKDYKLAIKRHLDIDLLDDMIRALSRGETDPNKRILADRDTWLSAAIHTISIRADLLDQEPVPVIEVTGGPSLRVLFLNLPVFQVVPPYSRRRISLSRPSSVSLSRFPAAS